MVLVGGAPSLLAVVGMEEVVVSGGWRATGEPIGSFGMDGVVFETLTSVTKCEAVISSVWLLACSLACNGGSRV